MNTRITLTAVALGMMVLSGCNSMAGKEAAMAPKAEAPAVAAPAAEAPAVAAPAAPEYIAVGDIDGAATVEETVVMEQAAEPMMTKDAMAADDAMMKKDTMAADDAMMKKDAMAADDAMMKKDAMAADDTMMAKDEMSTDDAAFNACFAGGGQVVNFIGDPSGATMACEVDGTQTIL